MNTASLFSYIIIYNVYLLDVTVYLPFLFKGVLIKIYREVFIKKRHILCYFFLLSWPINMESYFLLSSSYKFWKVFFTFLILYINKESDVIDQIDG